MIDKYITWIDHIRTVENVIAKNIGLLYRAKQLLNTSYSKSIYFSYIHTNLYYANIVDQLNIYQNVNFMHRLKTDNIPQIFTELIKKPKHKYLTKLDTKS